MWLSRYRCLTRTQLVNSVWFSELSQFIVVVCLLTHHDVRVDNWRLNWIWFRRILFSKLISMLTQRTLWVKSNLMFCRHLKEICESTTLHWDERRIYYECGWMTWHSLITTMRQFFFNFSRFLSAEFVRHQNIRWIFIRICIFLICLI